MDRPESFSLGWFTEKCPLAWNPSQHPNQGREAVHHLGPSLVLPPAVRFPGCPAGISNDSGVPGAWPFLPVGQAGMPQGVSYREAGGPCV